MFPSIREAAKGKTSHTDDELVALARDTNDWRSLYDVFCMLLSEKKKTQDENNKLIRLLSGEEVELECKNPGYRAVVKLDTNRGSNE